MANKKNEEKMHTSLSRKASKASIFACLSVVAIASAFGVIRGGLPTETKTFAEEDKPIKSEENKIDENKNSNVVLPEQTRSETSEKENPPVARDGGNPNASSPKPALSKSYSGISRLKKKEGKYPDMKNITGIYCGTDQKVKSGRKRFFGEGKTTRPNFEVFSNTIVDIPPSQGPVADGIKSFEEFGDFIISEGGLDNKEIVFSGKEGGSLSGYSYSVKNTDGLPYYSSHSQTIVGKKGKEDQRESSNSFPSPKSSSFNNPKKQGDAFEKKNQKKSMRTPPTLGGKEKLFSNEDSSDYSLTHNSKLSLDLSEIRNNEGGEDQSKSLNSLRSLLFSEEDEGKNVHLNTSEKLTSNPNEIKPPYSSHSLFFNRNEENGSHVSSFNEGSFEIKGNKDNENQDNSRSSSTFKNNPPKENDEFPSDSVLPVISEQTENSSQPYSFVEPLNQKDDGQAFDSYNFKTFDEGMDDQEKLHYQEIQEKNKLIDTQQQRLNEQTEKIEELKLQTVELERENEELKKCLFSGQKAIIEEAQRKIDEAKKEMELTHQSFKKTITSLKNTVAEQKKQLERKDCEIEKLKLENKQQEQHITMLQENLKALTK
jgi:hypothetical protein